jgi:geranylgeranyl diphosphate synthase type II
MEFESSLETSSPEYLEMIRLKTAVLLAFGFKSAAMISMRADLSHAFYEIGIHIGQAFQLEDDWLDFYATEHAFGKVKGGDLIQAKKSALILELLEQFNNKQQTEFLNWYQQEKDHEIRLSRMSNYLMNYGIKEKLKLRIQQYQTFALNGIDKLAVNSDQKASLMEFAIHIFSRKI